MTTVIETIRAQRIIAVVRLEYYDQALAVTQALLAGGIAVIEFTLTGKGAHQAIEAVRAEFGERILVGVGTVLQLYQAEEAMRAGAQFVVTPVVQPNVINVCRSQNTPTICGALTPTEALAAHTAGADLIKIFPARLGGPSYIRDLLAPLPFLGLVPTGGVSASNARAYIEAGAVAIGAGGNLVSAQAVARKNWEEITAQAQAYVGALA
jgi:2-dehydro-3-deoxyphosphogluconate aldolase / (4S)-4-hydroxy-2-oxoglutarate aldolase